jgi:dienelactone hydrolase
VERDDLKARLLECLGGPWPVGGDLRVQTGSVSARNGFRTQALSYEAEPGDRVPALLMVPDGVDATNPAPAVVVWHQHNGQWDLGKSEPAGLAGNPMHHTGAALAKLGFVVLCPDALGFEERRDQSLLDREAEEFHFLRYLVAGRCLAWKNILDMRRAIDFLWARPEVDSTRIAGYGHSMGSTFSWLLGPWEPRLSCLVGNCCLPTYAAIHRHKLLHCFTNFIPGWMRYGDTPDIAGLSAPTPLLLNFGELDRLSPIEEVRAGVEVIARAYREVGLADRFSYFIEEGVGHVLSEAMWQRTGEWLRRHLRMPEPEATG